MKIFLGALSPLQIFHGEVCDFVLYTYYLGFFVVDVFDYLYGLPFNRLELVCLYLVALVLQLGIKDN